MGQKTHPYGFRLNYNTTWHSRWYAEGDYAKLLHDDLKLRAQLKKRLGHAGVSEIDIEHIMRQEFTATCTDGDTVAFGDGVPHARFYGTMPRKIRRYAMDRGIISVPFAVRSMTSLPGQIMRLEDRGWIRVGYWADLVLFDESIADLATFTEPHQYPRGIPYVFVNGVAVVDDGRFTKAVPGKVLSPRQ